MLKQELTFNPETNSLLTAGLEIKKQVQALTSGLEIHQQLDSHKLFCNCPSILRNDKPDVIIRRKLHAVAGETGEIDIAAKHEIEKDKEFIYEGYSDTNCLLEYDESPPLKINQEALQIAIHISLLLNCEILPITQIMRKTVIDGSNISGFQRTILIGKKGYIETKQGKVGINYIYLEEDAARTVSEENQEKTYRLDRLGIPLVEIVTAPDIKSPEQCKEVALQIGDILRSCKVKRGIGTIRQDINVSIPGHPRAEIKGFQDPDIFIDVVKKEMERQAKELEKLKRVSEKNTRDKKFLRMEVRGANPDATTKFLRPLPGSARMYPETDLPLLKISKQMIDEAKRTLPKLRSEIKKELMKKGLREDEIQVLLKQNKLEDFKALLKIINKPRIIYKSLIEIPKEIAKHSRKPVENILTLDIIESIIHAINQDKLDKYDIKYVMEEIVNGKSFDEAIKVEKVDLSEIESKIAGLVKEKPGLTIKGYMGLIMKKFKGKVSGKEVSEILKKLVK